MGAPAIALGAVGLGYVVDGIGKLMGNHAAAKAEEQNQEFYGEQATFAAQAGKRAEDTFIQSTSDFIGNQTSAFAKAGVDLSGSALLVMQDTKSRARDEQKAIETETALNVRTAQLRGQQAGANASNYSNFWNNALPIGGSLLKGAGQIYSDGKKTGVF